METLYYIDFHFEVPIENVFTEYNKKKSENEKMSLPKYKEKVYKYTETSDHKEKDEFRNIIEQVKTAFRSNLSDKDLLKIRKIRKRISNLETPYSLEKGQKRKRMKQRNYGSN